MKEARLEESRDRSSASAAAGGGHHGERRIDEEEMMEGGLRGRFSAGGEVYFSAKQRSFGSEWLPTTRYGS